MSVASAIAGSVRGLLIAAATGVAALGLVALFTPPDAAPAPVSRPAGKAGADLLRNRIEAARLALRDTEAGAQPLAAAPPAALAASSDARARRDAQLAAITERRDLARRRAAAIREALARDGDVASLAGIRDSVVAGQLLARQAALEADIAEAATRLRPGHPTMLALAAQQTALARQLRAEAAAIATALAAEADIDTAQLSALQQGLAGPAPAASPSLEAAPLREKALAQRAELDGLLQAYLDLGLDPAAPAGLAAASPRSGLPAPLNLLVAATAGLAALVFQVALARRRRRLALAADIASWRADAALDPDLAPAARVAERVAPPLRAAS